MKSLTLTLVFLIPCTVAHASNASCPPVASPVSVEDSSIQNGSPIGCTQVNMQFQMSGGLPFGSLVNPNFSGGGDSADNSSSPIDSRIFVGGSGDADGIGAASQLVEFSEPSTSGFSASSTGANGSTENWDYTFTFAVTDLNPDTGIIGAYFALNGLTLSPDISFGVFETICPGLTDPSTFDPNCANKTVISYSGATSYHVSGVYASSAVVQVEFDPLLASGDSFSLASFDVGFDEGTPEPSTFVLLATGLFGLAVMIRRRRAVGVASLR